MILAILIAFGLWFIASLFMADVPDRETGRRGAANAPRMRTSATPWATPLAQSGGGLRARDPGSAPLSAALLCTECGSPARYSPRFRAVLCESCHGVWAAQEYGEREVALRKDEGREVVL